VCFDELHKFRNRHRAHAFAHRFASVHAALAMYVKIARFFSFFFSKGIHGFHDNNKKVAISAQDCHAADGAFTGEVSASALADFGVNWVILGHSERRHVFGESDEVLGKKLQAALAAGLHVIYCIGELEKERDEGRTNAVLAAQLVPLLQPTSPIDWSRIVIAYEPVWAIGTGKNATPAIAQETHQFVRSHIAQHAGAAVAQSVRVLYGGSVKANNCVELAACADVDGFLVGGASLLADQFEAILKSRAAKL
jgi:triosephosphate isomerase